MSEIERPLIKLEEGSSYESEDDDFKADAASYVITDDHTLNDILRFLISESDKEEIETLLGMM